MRSRFDNMVEKAQETLIDGVEETNFDAAQDVIYENQQ